MPAAPQNLTQPRFAQGFSLAEGDVVALAGGTGMVKQNDMGHMETFLTLSAAGRHVAFRNISWQADTVYLRQRPLNFGSQLEFLNRIQATVIIAHFGHMESLDGTARLAEFVAAYEALLDEFTQRTPNIVLITPMPFAAQPDRPHVPDLTRHNPSVKAYASAICDLARRRELPCIDLVGFKSEGYTRDGVHLTPAGQAAWAGEVARQLLHQPPEFYVTRDGAFEDAEMETMRQAILGKNRLWQRHWRPTNWAFVYGDRQHVPSSHDHRPGQPRWFPAELDAILPHIQSAEREIFSLNERQ